MFSALRYLTMRECVRCMGREVYILIVKNAALKGLCEKMILTKVEKRLALRL